MNQPKQRVIIENDKCYVKTMTRMLVSPDLVQMPSPIRLMRGAYPNTYIAATPTSWVFIRRFSRLPISASWYTYNTTDEANPTFIPDFIIAEHTRDGVQGLRVSRELTLGLPGGREFCAVVTVPFDPETNESYTGIFAAAPGTPTAFYHPMVPNVYGDGRLC